MCLARRHPASFHTWYCDWSLEPWSIAMGQDHGTKLTVSAFSREAVPHVGGVAWRCHWVCPGRLSLWFEKPDFDGYLGRDKS